MFCALREVGVTVIVPAASVRTSRPTPPTPATRFTSLAIGGMRNISIAGPGRVGVWTKADSVTAFTALSVPAFKL